MTLHLNDVSMGILGYKSILKSVIRCQIQHLVEQLAANTDDESIFLTASVSDSTLSHLGSETGKDFLKNHEDIKLQFLGFCLQNHYEKKLELQRQENESFCQETSFPNNGIDENEIYTATKCYIPTGLNIIDKVTPNSPSLKSRTSSPHIRFEPYGFQKHSGRKHFNNYQGEVRNHVFGKSAFNIPSTSWSNDGDFNDQESSSDTFETHANFHVSKVKPNVPPSIKTDQCNSITPNNLPVSNLNDFGHPLKGKVENSEEKTNVNSSDNGVNSEREYKKDTNKYTHTKEWQNFVFTSSIKTKEPMVKDHNEKTESSNIKSSKSRPDMQEVIEKLHLQTSVENIQNKSNIHKRGNENSMTNSNIHRRSTSLDFKEDSKGSNELTELKNATNEHKTSSYMSKLRSSKSLLRKQEVDKALKLAKARLSLKKGSIDQTISLGESPVDTSYSETDEAESEGNPENKIEDKKTTNQAWIKDILLKKYINVPSGHGMVHSEKTLKTSLSSHECNSESEPEIVAIEPGSVFVFKNSFDQMKQSDNVMQNKEKVLVKHTKKTCNEKAVKSSSGCDEFTLQITSSRDGKDRNIRLCPEKSCHSKMYSNGPFEATEKQLCATINIQSQGGKIDEPQEDKIDEPEKNKFDKFKKNKSAPCFPDVTNSKIEVIKNKRRRYLLKKKASGNADFTSNGRKKEHKQRKRNTSRKRRISEKYKNDIDDEDREVSRSRCCTDNQAETSFGDSDIRRSGNLILPPIFTKLSLDNERNSIKDVVNYNNSTKSKSGILMKKIHFQQDEMSDEDQRYDSIAQAKVINGLKQMRDPTKEPTHADHLRKKQVLNDGQNHSSCTENDMECEYTKAQKVETLELKENNGTMGDNANNMPIMSNTQYQLNCAQTYTKERKEKDDHDDESIKSLSVKKNAYTDENKDYACITSRHTHKKKSYAVNIFETFGKPFENTTFPVQPMCIENQIMDTNKCNESKTGFDNGESKMDTGQFGASSALKNQLAINNSNIDALKSDKSSSDKISNQNKESFEEEYHNDKVQSGKHGTEESCSQYDLVKNLYEIEYVSKAKSISVTLPSLTETISSVTSSISSASNFSLLMKTPSLVTVPKSTSNISPALLTSQSLSSPNASLPCYSKSDSSSVSGEESEIEQTVNYNDIENVSNQTLESFGKESESEIDLNTTKIDSNMERQSTDYDKMNDVIIVKNKDEHQIETLNSHFLDSLHTNYTCDTCDRTFQCKSTLSDHMTIHTGQIILHKKDEHEIDFISEGSENMNPRDIEVQEPHKEIRKQEEEKLSIFENLCQGKSFDKMHLNISAPVGKNNPKKRKRVTRKYVMENRSIFHSKRPRRFSCLFCGKKFCLEASMEKHIRWDHFTEIHSACCVCGADVTTTSPNIIRIRGSLNGNISKRNDDDCTFGPKASDFHLNDGNVHTKKEAMCERCKELLHAQSDSQSDVYEKNQAENISSSNKDYKAEIENNHVDNGGTVANKNAQAS